MSMHGQPRCESCAWFPKTSDCHLANEDVEKEVKPVVKKMSAPGMTSEVFMQTFTPSLPAAPIAHALQFANPSTNDSASADEMAAVAQAWQLRADRAKFVADALRSQVESESGRIVTASAGVLPTTV